jgi:hypothetical protein
MLKDKNKNKFNSPSLIIPNQSCENIILPPYLHLRACNVKRKKYYYIVVI